MALKDNLKHIFFDLDHTLWDFDKNSGLAFKALFEQFEIPLQLDQFLKVYEPINLEYWRLYRDDLVTKTQLRRGRLNNSFKQFDLIFPVEVIDAMAHQYIEELPKNNHLFKGTFELLDYLAPKYTLHIITNGFHEVQHKKLQTSGIASYFKTVTTSEDAGVKKPNPVIFEHALAISKAKPQESLMVGDSFAADIEGAGAMGFKTLFFNYDDKNIPDCGPQVRELSQINCLL